MESRFGRGTARSSKFREMTAVEEFHRPLSGLLRKIKLSALEKRLLAHGTCQKVYLLALLHFFCNSSSL